MRFVICEPPLSARHGHRHGQHDKQTLGCHYHFGSLPAAQHRHVGPLFRPSCPVHPARPVCPSVLSCLVMSSSAHHASARVVSRHIVAAQFARRRRALGASWPDVFNLATVPRVGGSREFAKNHVRDGRPRMCPSVSARRDYVTKPKQYSRAVYIDHRRQRQLAKLLFAADLCLSIHSILISRDVCVCESARHPDGSSIRHCELGHHRVSSQHAAQKWVRAMKSSEN